MFLAVSLITVVLGIPALAAVFVLAVRLEDRADLGSHRVMRHDAVVHALLLFLLDIIDLSHRGVDAPCATLVASCAIGSAGAGDTPIGWGA